MKFYYTLENFNYLFTYAFSKTLILYNEKNTLKSKVSEINKQNLSKCNLFMFKYVLGNSTITNVGDVCTMTE